jgi:hypothetical protein
MTAGGGANGGCWVARRAAEDPGRRRRDGGGGHWRERGRRQAGPLAPPWEAARPAGRRGRATCCRLATPSAGLPGPWEDQLVLRLGLKWLVVGEPPGWLPTGAPRRKASCTPGRWTRIRSRSSRDRGRAAAIEPTPESPCRTGACGRGRRRTMTGRAADLSGEGGTYAAGWHEGGGHPPPAPPVRRPGRFHSLPSAKRRASRSAADP